jgi:hypothetical protein
VDVLQTKTLTGNTVDDFARAVNGESFGESTFKTYSISEEKIDEIISGRNSDEKADDKGTEEKGESKRLLSHTLCIPLLAHEML